MSLKRLWRLRSIVETRQIGPDDLECILYLAGRIKQSPKRYEGALSGKIIKSLFLEPSTRTRTSFSAAAMRLGGSVIPTESGGNSSIKKGETYADTARVLSALVDAIVFRCGVEGGAAQMVEFSEVPVINAGDGINEHPTQALTDIFTMLESFARLDGLTIVMAGDLLNGRTVHSLAYLLADHYPDNELVLVSPQAVRMPEPIRKYLTGNGVRWSETTSFDDALPRADVLYQARVRIERYDRNPGLYQKVMDEARALVLDETWVDRMKENAIIFHPLPRVNEISVVVDDNRRARYFKQAQNGLFVRMALLLAILNPERVGVWAEC